MTLPRLLLTLLAAVAFSPSSGTAQEYGLLLGLGRTAWDGAAEGAWRSNAGLTLGAFTGEWSLGRSSAARVELGGGARVADLGRTGLFAEDTRVSFHRVQLGVLLRQSRDMGAGGVRLFAEGGGIGWLRTLCDVDLEGGPGFLGGETVGCAEWATDDGVGPLLPRGSGVAWTLGAGVRLQRWAFGLRFEREGRALFGTPSGEVRPNVLQLTGQWVISRRSGPVDRSSPEEGPPMDPRVGADDVPGAGDGRLEGALIAGALEAWLPTAGYLYAGRWGEALVPNSIRVTGPLAALAGWGTDSEGLVITGLVMYGVGTVWAVTGAARRAWRRG